ncbi:MAG: LUD domain-containing protein [Aeropyrum sp.]|nr:LUD domain-containing protein [Aeropyrum sp.]MCE4616226.1 LUD domain-containing protein [Aeropyrum sp.]
MGGLDDILEEILEALGDADFQEGLRKSGINNQKKVREILESNPILVEKAKRVARVKRDSVRMLADLVDKAARSLERNGARVYYAETAEDAREIVSKIVGRGKTVVMSKSMAAEEIDLRRHLEALDNEVWETDLGQLLVALEGRKPMHTVAPAIHMTRERAARIIRDKLGIELDPRDVEGMVYAVRRFLREKFFKADVGISGCNSLAADTGTLVLVENEGNIRMVSSTPEKHVAIAPIDKIVPTIWDAIDVALVQAAYAGFWPPTYISLISGPSATGDIEQIKVHGAHGPRELHVVLLDNGRMSASSHPFYMSS